MTEPTIICPNCKTEIRLTESLAAPLLETTRKQFEKKLAQKDSDIAAREQAARDKERELLNAKSKLDEEISDQVQVQLKKDRVRITAEAEKKANQIEVYLRDIERNVTQLSLISDLAISVQRFKYVRFFIFI